MQASITLDESETPVDAPCTICGDELIDGEEVYLDGHVRACESHIVLWDPAFGLTNECGCFECIERVYDRMNIANGCA